MFSMFFIIACFPVVVLALITCLRWVFKVPDSSFVVNKYLVGDKVRLFFIRLWPTVVSTLWCLLEMFFSIGHQMVIFQFYFFPYVYLRKNFLFSLVCFSFVYLYQHGPMDSYLILWVMTHYYYYLFWWSNNCRFCWWEPLSGTFWYVLIILWL